MFGLSVGLIAMKGLAGLAMIFTVDFTCCIRSYLIYHPVNGYNGS